ncbi:Probable NAD(P) transhydrogenase, alpha2 subunit PntAB [Mycobacteroides abscessus subsp. abscessus]|nr:Probable NAD(P) transhydrogenase, alpha2 subunit PntAB [Mycobacteroides abscessus subsp. abscessus]
MIGGFLVTDRMLGMFKSKKPAQSEQQKEAAK